MEDMNGIDEVDHTMNKTWLGVIGTVLVIVLLVWLLGGTSISCRESFWDKDKQVIEIKR
jgi:hypothetical protein